MRRYRSNLQALFLVHPAASIQVAVDQKQEYNVERTEEIPSATGSAKKPLCTKEEGRTAALITKRDFLVTESASPVFGHSRAVSRLQDILEA